MDDLKWLALVAIMTLAGLAYIALLGDGGPGSGTGAGEKAGS